MAASSADSSQYRWIKRDTDIPRLVTFEDIGADTYNIEYCELDGPNFGSWLSFSPFDGCDEQIETTRSIRVALLQHKVAVQCALKAPQRRIPFGVLGFLDESTGKFIFEQVPAQFGPVGFSPYCVVGEDKLVFGGYEETIPNVFNASTHEWKQLTPLPKKTFDRTEYVITALGSVVHVVGGLHCGDEWTHITLDLDAGANARWVVTPRPHTMELIMAPGHGVTFNGSIYANFDSKFMRYNPGDGGWKRLEPDMPTDQEEHPVGDILSAYSKKLLLFNTHCRQNPFGDIPNDDRRMHEYDERANRYVTLDIKMPAYSFEGIVID